MTIRRPARALLFSACALSLWACALTGKSEALAPRFYTPETIGAPSAESPRAAPARPLELRIGRITAAADLKENMAFRDGTHEVGYYDERLWTERPDAYLARALGRALFDQRGLRHMISGAGPTLDVRLLAFEEIRIAPRRVRVRIAITLHDERAVLVEETLTMEHPLAAGAAAPGADEVARVLGETLAAAVARVADRVETALQPVALPSSSAGL
jgi:cholesterol transport system auxiliary component